MHVKKVRSSGMGIVAALVLAVGLGAGCGGSDSDPPPSVDVTGLWTGTALADSGTGAAVIMNATQTGATVTGTCTVEGAPMTVTGTVSDNKWNGTLSADWGMMMYKLTVSGNTASGSGTDGTDSGSVTLTRSAN